MNRAQIKFLQINLQHSRVATNNLIKIIYEDGTDVLCIQEPYIIRNKIAGFPINHKIYASGDGRHRAAILVTNNQIDSLLLRQLSDEDTVVLQVVIDKAKNIIASMYFYVNRQIEDDLNKVEAIIHHVTGAGVILSMDSNSRSTSWHNSQSNTRGRTLEEFLIIKHLHVMNEESTLTTFLSSRGSNKIDLTVISSQLLRAVELWEVSDQESCSDHRIIKFAIGQCTWLRSNQKSKEVRSILKSEDRKIPRKPAYITRREAQRDKFRGWGGRSGRNTEQKGQ
jgi:hypothetical protein